MEPTKLQMFVAEVKGTAESEYIGLSKQIPLRLQVDLFASVMALHTLISEKQKTPRNKVLNDLIAISVDQVVDGLDEETRHKFNAIASHYLDELSQYDSGDL
ncbi:hypothetical protein OQG76_10495, partial [Streptococcus macedonicus]